MLVVPCGSTARTNWLTVSMPDSTCMCPSQSPGIRNRPPASITFVSGPIIARASGPQDANRPAFTAMSLPSITSRDCTLTQAQLRITRSAGARRAATAISSAATSGQAGKGRASVMARPSTADGTASSAISAHAATTTIARQAASPRWR